jgi:hypothetical protein
MKVAETFEQKEIKNLPKEVYANEYLNKFADKMMHLSNRLNQADDNDDFADDIDIKRDYLPAIQEFISNINGL